MQLRDRAVPRPAGIGRNSQIKGAIIESNVSIGADVTILNAAGVQEADRSETGGYIIQVGLLGPCI